MFEYLKVSAGVPALSLANAEVNSASVVEIISIAENNKSDIVVFPELGLPVRATFIGYPPVFLILIGYGLRLIIQS